MATFNRRSTPKVVDGRVQKKNRHNLTPTYWTDKPVIPKIDKERAGKGYKHLLSKQDIFDVIDLIPDWNQYAVGLAAVLLAEGKEGADGWYSSDGPHHGGVIGLCAWERDLWRVVMPEYVDEHHELFQRLNIPLEPKGRDVLCKFTEDTARAYLLLHVFLHELGHHFDRMTSRKQNTTGRGELFAEKWALDEEKVLWNAYQQKFGML